MPTLRLLFVRLILLLSYLPLRFIIWLNIREGVSGFKTIVDFNALWKEEWKEQTLL